MEVKVGPFGKIRKKGLNRKRPLVNCRLVRMGCARFSGYCRCSSRSWSFDRGHSG